MATTAPSHRPWEMASPTSNPSTTPRPGNQLPSITALTSGVLGGPTGSGQTSPASTRERSSGAWSSQPQSTREFPALSLVHNVPMLRSIHLVVVRTLRSDLVALLTPLPKVLRRTQAIRTVTTSLLASSQIMPLPTVLRTQVSLVQLHTLPTTRMRLMDLSSSIPLGFPFLKPLHSRISTRIMTPLVIIKNFQQNLAGVVWAVKSIRVSTDFISTAPALHTPEASISLRRPLLRTFRGSVESPMLVAIGILGRRDSMQSLLCHPLATNRA